MCGRVQCMFCVCVRSRVQVQCVQQVPESQFARPPSPFFCILTSTNNIVALKWGMERGEGGRGQLDDSECGMWQHKVHHVIRVGV